MEQSRWNFVVTVASRHRGTRYHLLAVAVTQRWLGLQTAWRAGTPGDRAARGRIVRQDRPGGAGQFNPVMRSPLPPINFLSVTLRRWGSGVFAVGLAGAGIELDGRFARCPPTIRAGDAATIVMRALPA